MSQTDGVIPDALRKSQYMLFEKPRERIEMRVLPGFEFMSALIVLQNRGGSVHPARHDTFHYVQSHDAIFRTIPPPATLGHLGAFRLRPTFCKCESNASRPKT